VRAVAGDEARIHLVRVLSERGVGSLMHILHALARLPRLLQGPGAPRHLIVNLSLVAEVPSHAVLMRWLLPETAADADAMLGDMEDAVRLLEAMSLPLRETLDWLIERDVLVVAAAGNHGVTSPGTRHATQEPARFDNVLAVAATDGAHRSAGFSNRGDMIVMGNGVATFGGNAGPDGRLVALDGAGPKRFDAPIGLYTAPRVGASDADNATGWAYWAGTSFAAPIITGLAARLWHQDPELTARQVMGAVRAVARSSEAAADLDVPVVRVVQRD
ncbi:MAG TPA: S8 family serine peptidase, partial [Gemmatimonadales bacterium]|nr:S8 family serine peptidase [Gemmatimonadales bacterium]